MKPTYGHTRKGLPVHAHIWDHHPIDSAYDRFNKKLAIWITTKVGSMTSFYLFNLLSFCSLPAVLSGVHALPPHLLPGWLVGASFISLIAWIAQTWLQLILLPGLMVGQTLQNQASDARAAKQFEDTELIVDRLDLETQGGLQVLDEHLQEIRALLEKRGKK